MEVDHGLLASIASGGLGKWEKDRTGRAYYRKHDDCLGTLWAIADNGIPGLMHRSVCSASRSFMNPASSLRRNLPDAAGCLRDLQRMLREDDPEERPAFLAAARYNFARSDLVPLLTTYPDDEALVLQTGM